MGTPEKLIGAGLLFAAALTVESAAYHDQLTTEQELNKDPMWNNAQKYTLVKKTLVTAESALLAPEEAETHVKTGAPDPFKAKELLFTLSGQLTTDSEAVGIPAKLAIISETLPDAASTKTDAEFKRERQELKPYEEYFGTVANKYRAQAPSTLVHRYDRDNFFRGLAAITKYAIPPITAFGLLIGYVGSLGRDNYDYYRPTIIHTR